MAILILGLTLSAVVNHDVAMAIFTMTESSEGIEIKVNLDKHHLAQETSIASEQLTADQLEQYLRKHLQFFIDNQQQYFVLVDYQTRGEHLLIKLLMDKKSIDGESLRIINTCLLTVQDQSNIIQLELNNKTRDYRMHIGRQEIEVSY